MSGSEAGPRSPCGKIREGGVRTDGQRPNGGAVEPSEPTDRQPFLRRIPHLPKLAIAAALLTLASQVNIAMALGSFAPKLGALQLSPSYAAFTTDLGTWSPSDIAHYHAHFGFDLVHPILYGVALALNLLWGLRAAGFSPRLDALIAAPLLAGLLDQLENGCHYVAVTTYAAMPEGAVDLATIPWWTFGVGSTAAKVKWILALGTLASLPVLAVLAWRRRARTT